jgi:hypothetical protein
MPAVAAMRESPSRMVQSKLAAAFADWNGFGSVGAAGR